MEIESLKDQLSDSQYSILKDLQQKSTSNITYRLGKKEKEDLLQDFGHIIQALMNAGMVSQQSILHRIYTEQCTISDGREEDQNTSVPIPKDPKEVSSASVQSVHDPEAAYRKKGEGDTVQRIKGYHCNITETCDESGKPNLITDVITTPANISECEYLEAAIDRTNEKLPADKCVKEVITDGGYDSQSNRKATQEEGSPELKMHKLKGCTHAFDMECNEAEELKIKDKKTQEELEVLWSEKAQKYKWKRKGDKVYRYMTKEAIQQYIFAAKIISQSTDHDYNLRSSVESTIHEIFHRLYRRSKIRYRGSTKCHCYALMQTLSVNISRIGRYFEENGQNFTNCLLRIVMIHIMSNRPLLFR